MRILVVDDESYIRELLISALESLGHELYQAADGREAISLFERVRPGILILDVSMPGLDGYHVLASIRQNESLSRTFVLMLTARAQLADLEKGLASGADDYLPKPFQLRELLARVNAAVRVRTMQDELLLKNQQLAEANLALANTLELQERLNRKMKLEMEVAARLQNRFFSPGSFRIGKVWGCARYQPSDDIGGDFYDMRPLGNDKAGIFLADAVGHGVSAALLAAMVKTALENALANNIQPSKVLSALNRSFQFCAEHGKFLTAFFGLLDCRTGDLVYSLAGHVPPMLYCTSTRSVEILDSPGQCLGIFSDGNYEDRQTRLCPGDRLFAYTDGISDASPDDRQPYGRCFQDLLLQNASLSNEDFLDQLDCGLSDFLGGKAPTDDYTLLSIRHINESAGSEPVPE